MLLVLGLIAICWNMDEIVLDVNLWYDDAQWRSSSWFILSVLNDEDALMLSSRF